MAAVLYVCENLPHGLRKFQQQSFCWIQDRNNAQYTSSNLYKPCGEVLLTLCKLSKKNLFIQKLRLCGHALSPFYARKSASLRHREEKTWLESGLCKCTRFVCSKCIYYFHVFPAKIALPTHPCTFSFITGAVFPATAENTQALGPQSSARAPWVPNVCGRPPPSPR